MYNLMTLTLGFTEGLRLLSLHHKVFLSLSLSLTLCMCACSRTDTHMHMMYAYVKGMWIFMYIHTYMYVNIMYMYGGHRSTDLWLYHSQSFFLLVCGIYMWSVRCLHMYACMQRPKDSTEHLLLVPALYHYYYILCMCESDVYLCMCVCHMLAYGSQRGTSSALFFALCFIPRGRSSHWTRNSPFS